MRILLIIHYLFSSVQVTRVIDNLCSSRRAIGVIHHLCSSHVEKYLEQQIQFAKGVYKLTDNRQCLHFARRQNHPAI